MRAFDKNIIVCLHCHKLAYQRLVHRQFCTRCGARLYLRKPNSIQRTWALLIAAVIIYIPANLLPIMSVSFLGKGEASTIMEGVIHLMHAKMYPIAFVVFFASIVVPTFKLVGLGLLLYSVQRHQLISAKQSILMYRFIEWIGRWSMLDIFVIATLVAVVRFDNLARIEAGTGALAFSVVVILTMLAAMTFDPRLIWDNTCEDPTHD